MSILYIKVGIKKHDIRGSEMSNSIGIRHIISLKSFVINDKEYIL